MRASTGREAGPESVVRRIVITGKRILMSVFFGVVSRVVLCDL